MARVGIIGASGFTGAELLRLAAAHPDLEVVLATGDTQAGTRGRRPVPEPGRRLPGPGVHAVRPGRVRRPRPGVPRPAARRQPGASCPSCVGKVGHLVDLAADFRLARPRALPAVVRRGPHRPRAAGRLRLRPARAVPGRDPGRRPRRRARLLPHRGRPWPWPRSCGPGSIETTGIIVDAASRRVRRRPARRSRPPPSAPSTRTSPPTACSTTGTPPRSSRPPGASVLFTPAPRADEPGHPGHLLRPAHRRRPPPTRCSTLLRTRLRRRAVRRRRPTARRPPRPPSARTAPTLTARFDERTGWVRRHRAPSTT